MRTQSCMLDGEKAPLPENAAALLQLCPGGGGVLFTRKLPSPATASRIANAMQDASVLAAAARHKAQQQREKNDGRAETAAAAVAAATDAAAAAVAPVAAWCVVHARNPYDVAVSQFQSFTQNHALPPRASPDARSKEVAKRRAERLAGPDAYALKVCHTRTDIRTRRYQCPLSHAQHSA